MEGWHRSRQQPNLGASDQTMNIWNGKDRLPVAILVDIDGTLVSAYKDGQRQLRSSALEALKTLAKYAPVFLWSIVGAENGVRLLNEFPQIKQYVAGCYGKNDFPLTLVDHVYCIDDEGIDEVVLQCNHVILNETYDGGKDSGLLMKAVQIIIKHLSGNRGDVL